MAASNDFQNHLQIVMDVFPATSFIVANEFYRESVHYKTTKLTQIAGIASLLTKDPDQTEHIDLFVNDMEPEDTLEALNQKIVDEKTDPGYFPKHVYDDFVQIRKQYKNLVVTKDPHDLIDILFSFQGLLQVYLRYYFDLIVAAQSDDSALHINKIFNILFATLKYQEAKYWNFYADSRDLQSQLFQIIKMDTPSSRHPVLRKHIFDSLKQYHPIVKDARTRFSTPEVRQVQKSQLQSFLALSIPRLAAIMETVLLTKGRSYLVYLLTQVLKSANKKIFELRQYADSDSTNLNKEFVELIDYFVDKLSSTQKRSNVKSSKKAEMGTVIQTAESLRRMKAKKMLEEREKKGVMNFDQVTNFFENKMLRMHARVQKAGALTASNISEYLSKFADSAQPLLMMKPGENKTQALTDFQVSADSIIADISKAGHLSQKQINNFKNLILKKSDQLANANEKQQAELIEQIGVILTNASIASDNTRRGKQKKQNAKVAANITLEPNKVSDFLEENLQNLYIKARQDGAITQNKVDDFLNNFSQAASKILVDIPVGQEEAVIDEFIISTDEILDKITDNGMVSNQAKVEYKTRIQTVYPKLKSAKAKERAQYVEQIGMELSNASLESNIGKDKLSGPRTGPSLQTQYLTKKVLTHNEVPRFLEQYLKKLYARVRKDGALTQDQISKYLQQFTSTARQIIFHIPPEKRPSAIKQFQISTDGLIGNMTRGSQLKQNEIREIRLQIHGKMKQLDTDNQQERIEVVDQIGLLLADTYDKVEKKPDKPGIDTDFLKKEIIPYGLDSSAKHISSNSFFSFPFGERRGPTSDKTRYDYHMKYLELIVKENKFKEEDLKKISDSLSALPRLKYKKYFNIFPNNQFEETTFMAVYDLWQNKALESLISN